MTVKKIFPYKIVHTEGFLTYNRTKEHYFISQEIGKQHQHLTRNIRMPGIVSKFKFCTFTQNRNGLISWNFEIPAYAYCHPLAVIMKYHTGKINV